MKIKGLMGHASILTTMRCIHATNQGKRVAIVVCQTIGSSIVTSFSQTKSGRPYSLRQVVEIAGAGEILGLKWEHVDFDRKSIYVAHTKTGRPRRIPMSAPVAVELRSLKQDASSDEHVFSYAHGFEADNLQARVGRSM